VKTPKSPELKRLRLRQVDERLALWLPLKKHPTPRGGWIRAVRHALGMGVTQLARRVGTRPPTILDFEKREVEGTITLNSLRRLAEAMDSTLVYALVPNTTLAGALNEQALRKAREARTRVGHSMALEAQDVDPSEAELQEREFAQKLLMDWPRTLWDDPDTSKKAKFNNRSSNHNQ
jgi:predicted DNA-binding mobile mystery protein A